VAEALPPPPSIAFLQQLGPQLHVLHDGAELWRLHFTAGAHPGAWNEFRHFGPTSARFDHHDGPKGAHPEQAILYGAEQGRTCLAEVYQEGSEIDKTRHSPHLAAFKLCKPLALLDVTGGWITRAGGNMAIGSGSRRLARAWSRAIYAAYPDVQGIRYASSVDSNAPAVALYERAKPALPSTPVFDRPLGHPGLAGIIADTCQTLGYKLS